MLIIPIWTMSIIGKLLTAFPRKRERDKNEREESKRVLQELKSVLGFKASEVERQKWKQLLFSDHGKHCF